MDFNKETFNLIKEKLAIIVNNIFPGILILELFFNKGFFSDNIYNLISYLIWGFSISFILKYILNYIINLISCNIIICINNNVSINIIILILMLIIKNPIEYIYLKISLNEEIKNMINNNQ